MTEGDGVGIDLPAVSEEALRQAAETVLGPSANESLLADGTRLFRGSVDAADIFLQGPNQDAGEILSAAARELQDQLMAEAAIVSAKTAERGRAKYADPAFNPWIKTD